MLTELEIKRAIPATKPRKIADAKGLYLLVTPAGGKLWRYKYRIAGKEKLLALGAWPSVSLASARARAREAREALDAGKDPAVRKPKPKTLEQVALEWHEKETPRWSKRHQEDVLHSLRRDVFPTLGQEPFDQISAPDILAVLRKIEDRPAIETAHRVRHRLDAVFAYGIAAGLCRENPAASVRLALKPLVRLNRQPAAVSLADAKQVLEKVLDTPANAETHAAFVFLALTAARPGEVLGARWSEIDFESKTWTIPSERMKGTVLSKSNYKLAHRIALSEQSIELLKVARVLAGPSALVFPSARFRDRPMSENALGYLCRRAGLVGKHVPHGWRASFSSIMNERHHADSRIIDAMLAHSPKDKVEASYNRAVYMERRRELAQEWADLLLPEGCPKLTRHWEAFG